MLLPQVAQYHTQRSRVPIVCLHEMGQEHCHCDETHRQVVHLPEGVEAVVVRLRCLRTWLGLDLFLRLLDCLLQRTPSRPSLGDRRDDPVFG